MMGTIELSYSDFYDGVVELFGVLRREVPF